MPFKWAICDAVSDYSFGFDCGEFVAAVDRNATRTAALALRIVQSYRIAELLADSPIMDVNCAFGTFRIFGTMLALAAAVRSAGADDAVVEIGDQASTLVVTASDADEGIEQPTPIGGSELVVHDDSVELASDEGAASSEQGTLAVVANSQRKSPLSAIVVDPAVQPASTRLQDAMVPQRRPAASHGNMFSGGPRRPGAAAGIQTRQHGTRVPSLGLAQRRTQQPAAQPSIQAHASARQAPIGRKPKTMPVLSQTDQREQPPQPRAAVALKSKAAAPKTSKQLVAGNTGMSPAHEMLVRAYQLSLTASTEAEYSQIVRWCAEGMRQGLDGENRKFALALSAWALNRRGQLRADQGQQEIAIADFRAALDFDPKCWRALHNRGVTFAQNGQFAEAFDDITKVIAINPQFAKAYSNRATLYVQAGDDEKAMADYESALGIDPTLLPALVGHGRFCHMTGRLDEALSSLSAAIEQDDRNAEVVCSRGDLLVDLGRYSEALEDYARAIDLNPNFEHAYRNGAWLLATCPDDSIRDAEGAINGAQAALECGYGERHAALDTLAAALANAGRFEEAVGTIQQAIEVAPEEAVPAYEARQQLYEIRQPFRAHPMDAEVQEVEFVEG